MCRHSVLPGIDFANQLDRHHQGWSPSWLRPGLASCCDAFAPTSAYLCRSLANLVRRRIRCFTLKRFRFVGHEPLPTEDIGKGVKHAAKLACLVGNAQRVPESKKLKKPVFRRLFNGCSRCHLPRWGRMPRIVVRPKTAGMNLRRQNPPIWGESLFHWGSSHAMKM